MSKITFITIPFSLLYLVLKDQLYFLNHVFLFQSEKEKEKETMHACYKL